MRRQCFARSVCFPAKKCDWFVCFNLESEMYIWQHTELILHFQPTRCRGVGHDHRLRACSVAWYRVRASYAETEKTNGAYVRTKVALTLRRNEVVKSTIKAHGWIGHCELFSLRRERGFIGR
ncbi:hypothetical protein F2P81_020572 [Scophthalmus maximus]|uniref:Uncharacterized protein n=1 Tax=Scophthalmus maximus TaxID=52904 RepID=A0A6A4S9Q8_SCOMX|nr:hypothetical protein F2P81_020572 [Scophthalmus maximus]